MQVQGGGRAARALAVLVWTGVARDRMRSEGLRRRGVGADPEVGAGLGDGVLGPGLARVAAVEAADVRGSVGRGRGPAAELRRVRREGPRDDGGAGEEVVVGLAR